MICRHATIVGRKTAVEQQLISTVALRIAPAILAVVWSKGVDIVENKSLNSCRTKGHGSLHLLTLEEAINTCQPTIYALLLRTNDKIFGYLVLLLALFERKVVLGQEVVVDVHLVVHILVRCDACQREFPEVVTHTQSVTYGDTRVGRRLVVADFAHQLLTVFFWVGRADIFVGITALLHHREGEGVVDAQRPLAVLELGAEVAAILLVAQRVVVEIAPIAVVTGILSRDRETKLLAQPIVARCCHSERVA